MFCRKSSSPSVYFSLVSISELTQVNVSSTDDFFIHFRHAKPFLGERQAGTSQERVKMNKILLHHKFVEQIVLLYLVGTWLRTSLRNLIFQTEIQKVQYFIITESGLHKKVIKTESKLNHKAISVNTIHYLGLRKHLPFTNF